MEAVESALLLFRVMCQKRCHKIEGWWTLTEEKCSLVFISFQGSVTLCVLSGSTPEYILMPLSQPAGKPLAKHMINLLFRDTTSAA
jgi:hypothetical protein